jgi:outer membrane immunogenic protein
MRRLALALLSATLVAVCGPFAVAAPVDDAARLEAVERENAVLRQEIAALRERERVRLKGEKAKIARRVESPPSPSSAVPPSGAIYAAVGPGAAVYKGAPAPLPSYGWTGFYAGVNLGLSIGQSPTSRSSQFVGSPSVLADRFDLSPFGLVGGAQLGFNWQMAPNWVAGVEADLQGSGAADTACGFQCTLPALAGFDRNITFRQRLDWFGTARGRFGWTNGPALIYATGGLAYGHVTTDVSLSDSNGGVPGVPVSGAVHDDATKVGWTAGFGGEMQLAGNWTGKLEYLYVDLGNVATGGFTSVFSINLTQTHQFDSTFRDHIVRLGVNYKFGEPVYASAAGNASAMFTKAPPPTAYDWTGFHVGANLGIGIGHNDTTMTGGLFNNTTGTVLPGLFNDQFVSAPLGAVGGVQVGYDWQPTRHWVLGAEADLQGSSQETNNCLNCGQVLGIPFGTTLTQQIQWFGTVRGRVGWTDGPILYYATGGLAYGHIKADLRDDTIPLGTGVTTSASFGQTNVGWTAGAGAEAHIYGNWTAKGEYLYVDLGAVSGNVIAPSSGNFSENRGFNTSIHDHVFRLGVNYKVAPEAVAADLPVKAPVVPPKPVFIWTGFYVGGNVGYSWGRASTDLTETTSNTATLTTPNGSATATATTTSVGNDRAKLNGSLGGFQAGYNWQTDRFVTGFEGDIQATGERGDVTICPVAVGVAPGPCLGPSGTLFGTASYRLPWFATLRGRAGVTFDRVMLYVTGGLAAAEIKADYLSGSVGFPASLAAGSANTTRVGWAFGGGIEGAIDRNWSIKAEYLHLDFGSFDQSVTGSGIIVNTNFGGTSVVVTQTVLSSFHTRATDDVFRIGVNYRFGGPVVAKY